jgi:hypothetical protein
VAQRDPIVTKSNCSLLNGSESPTPCVSGPLNTFFACASMPGLGSQPNTRPVGPTMRTAPRATAPVPVAMSSTFMPGFMPARFMPKRRYQSPPFRNRLSIVS